MGPQLAGQYIDDGLDVFLVLTVTTKKSACKSGDLLPTPDDVTQRKRIYLLREDLEGSTCILVVEFPFLTDKRLVPCNTFNANRHYLSLAGRHFNDWIQRPANTRVDRAQSRGA